MAKAARVRLARLLAGEEAGAFSAQLSVPSDALRLEVDDIGQVRLPVRPAQAKKLCGVARPAHFGHREETILDPAVRDTREISPDLVSLGGPSWALALEGALTELADELGVPVGNRLEAELHALLVYGPGQFFVPHTDTEKNDAMVGTLAVTLPSSHTGGEFIVEHGGQSVTYRSSGDSLSLVAFYADCLYQVTPVRTGYRVVTSFNLLMRGTPAADSADGPVPELAGCLAEHFRSPEQVRYGSSEPPKTRPASTARTQRSFLPRRARAAARTPRGRRCPGSTWGVEVGGVGGLCQVAGDLVATRPWPVRPRRQRSAAL